MPLKKKRSKWFLYEDVFKSDLVDEHVIECSIKRADNSPATKNHCTQRSFDLKQKEAEIEMFTAPKSVKIET